MASVDLPAVSTPEMPTDTDRWWASRSAATRSTSSRNVDDDALDRVVRVTADVPRRLVGLCTAGLVARAAAEHVRARRRLPLVAPAAPGPAAELVRLETCGVPRRAVVVTHLHALNRCVARPCAAADRVRARLRRALAGQEVRDAGRHHQRAR